MPSSTEDELLLRYGVVTAMYPLAGMIFAPLFGWLETAGTKDNTKERKRKKGVVRKIGIACTLAFVLGNCMYGISNVRQ